MAWPRGVAPATPFLAKGWLEPPPTAGLGVVEPPPWPKGWSGHPQKPKKKKYGFWPFGSGRTTPKGLGVDSATPYGRSGGGRTTLMAKGVVRPPPKGRNPYFVFCFFVFLFFLGFWELPDHPFGHGGGSTTPRPAVGGGRIHPQALRGGPATPKRPKPILHFFFLGLLGVAGPPLDWPWGWLQPSLGQATPQFPSPPPPLFIFFFIFKFYNFFLKKKINCKMIKMTSF
jgi:hypothetical protein